MTKILQYVPVFLVGVGVLLRIFQFGSIPASLNRDEAALGYNAWAIKSEGMDEWGERYPVTFKSFGDYKLPGYVYLDMVFQSFFGSNDLVVRLPSLLAGIGIIGLTYLLGIHVFNCPHEARWAAAVVALQPWAIFYSRMAYEANVGLFWLLLSFWLFFQSRILLVGLGVIAYGLAIVTYNAPLLLLPLLVLFFILLPHKRHRILILISVGLIAIGIFGFWLLSSVTAQKQGITLWSDPTLIDSQAKAYISSTTIFQKLQNHRLTFYSREALVNLIQSFSPEFLVLRGGANPWHTISNAGHLYWVTYVSGLMGILYYGWRKNQPFQVRLAWVLLFLGSLLPAIITVDAPHATRSLLFFWLMSFFGGYLISSLPRLAVGLVVSLLLLETLVWGYKYFGIFSDHTSTSWHVGLRERLLELRPEYTNGRPLILVSSETDLLADQVYIFPLWYLRVSPSTYIKTVTMLPADNANMIRVQAFDRVTLSNQPTSHYNEEAVVIERLSDGSYK